MSPSRTVLSWSTVPRRMPTCWAELLSTDENSNRIGEIALVPASSPINRSGVLFYNTLFDENAACHIAFGAGYPTNIRGGSAMTRDDPDEEGPEQLRHP